LIGRAQYDGECTAHVRLTATVLDGRLRSLSPLTANHKKHSRKVQVGMYCAIERELLLSFMSYSSILLVFIRDTLYKQWCSK